MTDRDSGLPDHEQRAWDAIVADLSGQIDLGPQFPKERSLPPLSADGDHPDPLADDVDVADEADWDDEPGFEPPEPPPIPRPRDTAARFAWAAALGGPVLILLTNVLGWDRLLAGVGVVATIGGFAALVARMKDREDGDDGAVV